MTTKPGPPLKNPAAGKRVTLCVRVEPATRAKLESMAKQYGMGLGELIDGMTSDVWREWPPEETP